jgi:hypothetical protein
MLQRIVVPNPNRSVSKFPYRRIAFGVGNAVCMLPAVDLDDEVPFAASKVGEIPPDWLLTHKFETRQLPIPQMPPKHQFGTRALPP